MKRIPTEPTCPLQGLFWRLNHYGACSSGKGYAALLTGLPNEVSSFVVFRLLLEVFQHQRSFIAKDRQVQQIPFVIDAAATGNALRQMGGVRPHILGVARHDPGPKLSKDVVDDARIVVIARGTVDDVANIYMHTESLAIDRFYE